jgi:hypothetical protein
MAELESFHLTPRRLRLPIAALGRFVSEQRLRRRFERDAARNHDGELLGGLSRDGEGCDDRELLGGIWRADRRIGCVVSPRSAKRSTSISRSESPPGFCGRLGVVALGSSTPAVTR